MNKIKNLLAIAIILMCFCTIQNVFGGEGDFDTQILSFTPQLASPQVVWTHINFTCTANDSYLNYDYYVYKEGLYQFNTGKTNNNQFEWTPSEPGNYVIKVIVDDGVTLLESEVPYTIDFFNKAVVASGYYLEDYVNGYLIENSTHHEKMSANDEIDIYQLTPSCSTNYDFIIEGYYDLGFYIYDSDFNLLYSRGFYGDNIKNMTLAKGQTYYFVIRELNKNNKKSQLYDLTCQVNGLLVNRSLNQPAGTTFQFAYYNDQLSQYNYKIMNEDTNSVIYTRNNQRDSTFEYTFLNEGLYKVSIRVAGIEYSELISIYNAAEDIGGNSFAEATSANVGITDDSLGHYRDCDYYEFVAPMTAHYMIYSVSDMDTYGYLYNSRHQLIEAGDDYDSDHDFRFQVDLTGGETYYIVVRGYDDEEYGDYSLRIEAPAFIATSPARGGVNEQVTISFDAREDVSQYRFSVFDENDNLVTHSGAITNNQYQFTPAGFGKYLIICDLTMNDGTMMSLTTDYFVSDNDRHGSGYDTAYQLLAGDSIIGTFDSAKDRDYYYIDPFEGDDGDYYVWLETEVSSRRVNVVLNNSPQYSFYESWRDTFAGPIVLKPSASGYILEVISTDQEVGDYTIRCERFKLALTEDSQAFEAYSDIAFECIVPINNANYEYTTYYYGEDGQGIIYQSGKTEATSGSMVASDMGNYNLKVKVTPKGRSHFYINQEFVVVEGADFYGNNYYSAAEIQTGDIIEVDSSYQYDQDWLKVVPKVSGFYKLNGASGDYNSYYNLQMKVYNSYLELLKRAEMNNHSKRMSSFVYLIAGNTYYINLDWTYNISRYSKTTVKFQITFDDYEQNSLDFNHDGIVDQIDDQYLIKAYGTSGISITDINDDMTVDILDIVNMWK